MSYEFIYYFFFFVLVGINRYRQWRQVEGVLYCPWCQTTNRILHRCYSCYWGTGWWVRILLSELNFELFLFLLNLAQPYLLIGKFGRRETFKKLKKVIVTNYDLFLKLTSNTEFDNESGKNEIMVDRLV